MRCKENKQKNKEFVDKLVEKNIREYLKYRFVLDDSEYSEYAIKRISKRKNKYHYKVFPYYCIISEIDFKITVEDFK